MSNDSTKNSPAQTIEIVVNGKPQHVPEGLNVAGLLTFLKVDPERVAVELNRSIVRKPEWGNAMVGEGANVEIVWFVSGGTGLT